MSKAPYKQISSIYNKFIMIRFTKLSKSQHLSYVGQVVKKCMTYKCGKSYKRTNVAAFCEIILTV